jgi:hypothetical protein
MRHDPRAVSLLFPKIGDAASTLNPLDKRPAPVHHEHDAKHTIIVVHVLGA